MDKTKVNDIENTRFSFKWPRWTLELMVSFKILINYRRGGVSVMCNSVAQNEVLDAGPVSVQRWTLHSVRPTLVFRFWNVF